jgi:DNA-binding beta-propeller fold protein YncE
MWKTVIYHHSRACRLWVLWVLLGVTGSTAFSQDLLVTSFFTNSVLRYDGKTGDFVDAFIPPASGGLDGPNGLLVAPNGSVFVSSYNNNSVLRYDGITGDPLGLSGQPDDAVFVPSGNNGLEFPQDLAISSTGELCVVAGDPGVLCYDAETGQLTASLGFDGSLVEPDGLFFAPDGRMYVGDLGTDNVKRFDEDAETFEVFASGGGLDGTLGVAFGPDGNLYAAGAFSDNVVRFDGQTGTFIDEFIAPGSGLDNPVDMIFSEDGVLYIDGFNSNNVLRFDATTGELLDVFISQGRGGLDGAAYMAFTIPEPSTIILIVVLGGFGWPWCVRRVRHQSRVQ